MEPSVRWWRKLVAGDVAMHMIAVLFFAYLPPSTLNAYEQLIMILAAAAFVGVLSHAFARVTLPAERWAYLAAAFVCVLTLLLYETRTLHTPIPLSVRIPFGLFLAAGAVSAGAAHVIDGGPPRPDRG